MRSVPHILLCSALLLVSLAGLNAADNAKPNIVFIFADDWGWGDLSCHGHPWLKTPNLDRLAGEGIDFQQFNVLNPVCSPSRSAAMTGHFPGVTAFISILPLPRKTLHATCPTGSIRRHPTSRDSLSRPVIAPRLRQVASHQPQHPRLHRLPRPTALMSSRSSTVAELPSADLHATPENAVKFIYANKDRPFFVNVWLHESHLPHVPQKASLEKWKELDEQKRVYAAVITDGDNAVGQVLDALLTAGVEQNTIVLFLATTARSPPATCRNKM